MTRVVLLDDHVAFADALSLALNMTTDLECVATSSDSGTVAELLRLTGARLLVSDQHLADGTTGLELIASLRRDHRRLQFVVLTGFPTPGLLADAGDLGVPVLAKDMPVREIVTALRQAASGGVPSAALRPDRARFLTKSEERVLQMLGQGGRVPDIAATLEVSVHTVRDHIKSVLRKLDVSSQLEAVVEANRRGLIAPPH